MRQPEEEKRFRELEETLEFRIPIPSHGTVERRAQEFVQALIDREFQGSPGTQEALRDKATKLLSEMASHAGEDE